MSKRYIQTSPRTTIEFPIVFLLMIIFLELLIFSFELVTMFGCIVGFSFCLYMLLFSDYTNYLAREAAIKYFYLSAISAAVLGFGILCNYDIFGVTQFIYIKLKINSFVVDYLILSPFSTYFRISITFIIIGFLFKLSAFPCHLWTPEVYEGSSDPVTAIFMLPIKLSVLGIFIRLLSYIYGTNLNIIAWWQPLIIASAVGSMIWGCLAAIQERKIKRFIAYTSINQMGFLLMGISCATQAAYVIALFYLLVYIVMLVGFLYIYLSITVIRIRNQKILFGSLIFLSDFNAFGKYYRVYALMLILIIFSMAGIPPLAGFLGKFYLFVEVFRCNLKILLILSLITSFISTYYYLRIISILFFDFYQNIKQNSGIAQNYIILYISSLDNDAKSIIMTIFCINYLLLIWVFNNIILDSLILIWSNIILSSLSS